MKDEDLTAVFRKGKGGARDLGHWVDVGRLRRQKKMFPAQFWNFSCAGHLFLVKNS